MVTPRRTVVGAHYGLGSWLAQRITAVIMALYSVLLLVVFTSGRPIGYSGWKELFQNGWMRVGTVIFAASLAWHAWVGVRDIVMDYIKPDGLRLGLQVATILVLASYVGWTVQVLWR
jgi:succinate dehydrogenase / fumarate reductase membrane anchor subunit